MAVLRALGVALLALLSFAPSRAATPGEYQVKAAFLYNFSRFDEAVRGEFVRGHPLVVRRVRSAAEAAGCQILFIHHTGRDRMTEMLAAVPVMIRFVTQNGRIRMRIDVNSARAAQLTVSSNLLRAAEIVGSAAREGS